MLDILDIEAVMVKRRQRAHDATDDGHRMRVAPKSPEEVAQLFVNHRVVGDGVLEIFLGDLIGQLAI